MLPLRCVICRARVNRLTSSSGTWRLQESASSYSMGARSWSSVGVSAGGVAASASSYSMNDAHSGHGFATPRLPRSPHGRVSQSDSLYSMCSTGSSSPASLFSKTSSVSGELYSPASPISPTSCSYAQTTTMIMNNHLAPPALLQPGVLLPHSPTSTASTSGSLSPREVRFHTAHRGCPTPACSGAIPRRPVIKSLSSSMGSGGSGGPTLMSPLTHTYPGRRSTKGRLVELQNRLPPIKEFRSPAKTPASPPTLTAHPRFR